MKYTIPILNYELTDFEVYDISIPDANKNLYFLMKDE